MTDSRDDVVVRLIDLPVSINGLVRESPDGMYNIYLNARLSHETQVKTLEHEMKHVLNGDFWSDEPIERLEGEGTGRRRLASPSHG